MALVTVGVGLDQRRAGAGPGAGEGLRGDPPHGEQVIAVNRDARDSIRDCPFRQPWDGGCRCQWAVLAVVVVLDDDDDRQSPDGRHVQALVEGADVGRTVAGERHAHLSLLAVLRGEARPDGDREVGTHYRVRADDALFEICEVHRAALAPAKASLAAENLAEGGVHRRARRENGPVAAVGACHHVSGGEKRAHTYRDGLLALAQVRAPPDKA